jgi:hypothetical protein
MKVVGRDAPLTSTFEELMKPVPVTVIVEGVLPARMDGAESDVITGAGLFTVKVAAVEEPELPPLFAVSASVAAVASCAAGMLAFT